MSRYTEIEATLDHTIDQQIPTSLLHLAYKNSRSWRNGGVYVVPDRFRRAPAKSFALRITNSGGRERIRRPRLETVPTYLPTTLVVSNGTTE